MKNKVKTILAFGIILAVVIVIEVLNAIDVRNNTTADYIPENGANIHLYGETHGSADYYNKELEAWDEYYKKGCRDLFVELPYYTAEFLNIWMQDDNDKVLEKLYDDIDGTASHTESFLAFYKTIKTDYPGTVFHGTDVGHQYDVTGARYIAYLEEAGLKDSLQYELAMNCIKQGEKYYGNDDTDAYREQMMVENFISAYERLGRKEIVGIYGSYHTNPINTDLMAGQIKAKYGDIVEGIYISNMLKPAVGKHFCFGFGYVGIVLLLMLFVPNIIWTKCQPAGYADFAKNENKVLGILERIGEVGATVLLPFFTDFNFRSRPTGNGGFYFSYLDLYIVLAFTLMILYEVFWCRYFESEHTMGDFYTGIAGIPLAGATLPVIALLLLGVSARNIALISVAVILGIGHIGIHYMHSKECVAMGPEKEKSIS